MTSAQVMFEGECTSLDERLTPNMYRYVYDDATWMLCLVFNRFCRGSLG